MPPEASGSGESGRPQEANRSGDSGRAPSEPKPKEMTYAGSGVDVSAARKGLEAIAGAVRSTARAEVVGELGSFAGLFALDTSRFEDPLLVAGADGAGTKVMVAQRMGVHDTIGIDLVAMCVNDVAALGAEPLFFLDHVVMERFDEEVFKALLFGVAEGCRQARCALLGGETAEHPGHMPEGSYDLAGFCVGVVDRAGVIDGSRVGGGDVLVGIASSGVHSNGFSLVRKALFEQEGLDPDERLPGLEATLGQELMRPTLIYSGLVSELAREFDVKGLAHISGGGLPENVARIMPPGFEAWIDTASWPTPPIFELISSVGSIPRDEMFSTFNMGIGMVVAVNGSEASRVIDRVRATGNPAFEIGNVREGDGEVVLR
jgi:phosphoribosylformylglycinamidine cyclo-ligase